MSLADRLRAAGVSEGRLFQIGLALRAPDVEAKATDEELSLAHEYNTLVDADQRFEAARLRAKNPSAVARGRKALRAIDGWIDRNQIQEKHRGA